MQTESGMLKRYLIITAALLTGACSSDVISADSAEGPSLDSALARDVMLAAHEPAYDSLAYDSIEPDPPLTLKVLDPIPVESVKIRSKAVAEAPKPAPAPSTSPARAPAAARAPLLVAAPKPQSRQSPPKTRVATVPAGTTLAVETGRRICVNSSRVGERFDARLSRALRLPSGATLPRGARVTGEVTSLFGRLGEERLQVMLRSVNVRGKSYRIQSRITEMELDRTPGAERCIPDDGTITARLTEPLRLSA
jgi:hypothetical protein